MMALRRYPASARRISFSMPPDPAHLYHSFGFSRHRFLGNFAKPASETPAPAQPTLNFELFGPEGAIGGAGIHSLNCLLCEPRLRGTPSGLHSLSHWLPEMSMVL